MFISECLLFPVVLWDCLNLTYMNRNNGSKYVHIYIFIYMSSIQNVPNSVYKFYMFEINPY